MQHEEIETNSTIQTPEQCEMGILHDTEMNELVSSVAPQTEKHTPYKHRSNKSAGVILIDPWTSSNIYDPRTYRVMVVQQRNSGAWGLPKGHLEKDEALLPAAHRELSEETGVCLDDLVEGEDYVPLYWKPNSEPSTNHLQIKKIHFFVYVLMRRGSSLIHGDYDQNEISAVSWMNVYDWFVDTPPSHTAKPQPSRFNRTLSDTAVNLLMDICGRTSIQLREKYGGCGYVEYQTPCVNLF